MCEGSLYLETAYRYHYEPSLFYINYFVRFFFFFFSKQNVVLAYKKTGFDSWVNPPFPIYFKVWMWNLTNADDVLKGAKPNVTQVGPYTYRY